MRNNSKKGAIKKTALLFAPLLFIIFINEYSRTKIKGGPYTVYHTKTINPPEKSKGHCSWYCHHHTDYCKKHHVKYAKHFFKITDPLYFGIINFLKSTGNYMLANIFFLAILLPLIIYFLLHLLVTEHKKNKG
ncbi:MAG TPA: hypothetical protein ENJ20_02095 [Bacteroidetes bacterium]|nr:hypothetical protein [Bacteroidota bacterium]